MQIGSRRVIPRGYHVAQLSLTGTSPLLMNSPEADRSGEEYRAFKSLGAKRGKTLEDEARLAELEWRLGIYFDDEHGPYIPGKNVKELLRSAATRWKLGSEVTRSLVVPDYRVPLQYDGPRDIDGLWAGGFRYSTMVRNAGASKGSVSRCRPMFPEWSLECEIAWDSEDLDLDVIGRVVDRSQKYGLGDYRPEFGSFSAAVTLVRVERQDTGASAVKPVNGREKAANDALTRRIKTTTT